LFDRADARSGGTFETEEQPSMPFSSKIHTAHSLTLSSKRATRAMAALAGLFALLLGVSQGHAQGMPISVHLFSGRNAATRAYSGTAILNITATIMPIVLSPQRAAHDRHAQTLFIDLPSPHLEMDVTRESRAMPDKVGAALQTTTVVPQ
jgi:hypothetical protein